ncbi:hypothetical protein IMSAGC015_01664 [Lachnospiraceae bacterium]|nr:hypothetical protein [Dorea sp.]GFI37477.1 hypothetical protein IMSAGC015_01664 [Lachnospiraceae bacterium]
MKEYKIRINGGADFVVVFPEVISSLISKIRDNGNEELVVGIEEVMPEQMTEYLLRVLNTNRFTNSQFRFRQILEDPITKEGLYQVLGEQLRGMDIDERKCFYKVELIEMLTGDSGLEIECTIPFLLACKDTAAVFLYTAGTGKINIYVKI